MNEFQHPEVSQQASFTDLNLFRCGHGLPSEGQLEVMCPFKLIEDQTLHMHSGPSVRVPLCLNGLYQELGGIISGAIWGSFFLFLDSGTTGTCNILRAGQLVKCNTQLFVTLVGAGEEEMFLMLTLCQRNVLAGITKNPVLERIS